MGLSCNIVRIFQRWSRQERRRRILEIGKIEKKREKKIK